MTLPALSTSLFRHIRDNQPQHHTIQWSELCKLLTSFSRRKDKDGPLWSPARYPAGEPRAKHNALELSCFVADVDEGAEPALLTQRWNALGLAYIVHSTWHHLRPKPGHPDPAPRWRAVFPLAAAVPAADWPEVYPRLATYLLGTLWDPACRDASRIHYLPSSLPDLETLAIVHEGRQLEPEEAPELPEYAPPKGNGRSSPSPARPTRTVSGDDLRPGDDYSERGDHRALLEHSGWTLWQRRGDNEHWTRPGKSKATSGTWHVEQRIFFCFTSSTSLEPNTPYRLFGLRAALEAVGHAQLAAQLRRDGFGTERPRLAAAAPPECDAPPPSDEDAPVEVIFEMDSERKSVVAMPAGLPAREDVARWAGFLAQGQAKAGELRSFVADQFQEAFAAGASVAASGGRIIKPADICDTDYRRFKRMMADKPPPKEKEPFELPVEITRLVRRPVANRATFDITLESRGKTATLTRLDGAALGSYSHIRDLALEHCIALPASYKPARDAWDELLAEAFRSATEESVEVEESILLALRQEIASFILDSEVTDKESDMRRGLVAQDEAGELIYIIPKILTSRIRARMEADKPTREQIIDAAKLLDMKTSRPTLPDGKRPNVWAFQHATLRQWQP